MLDESIAQRRADEEAARLSGKSDDEVAAELAAAEERFAKASTSIPAVLSSGTPAVMPGWGRDDGVTGLVPVRG
ncbi:hypothetical protein [Streptomyces cyaneochromogenes]|uniref:hypothetical protein n=1 Tax=Streptomyces cyaneochromogenes TaxID=2496836 RepID=UPI001E3DD6E5|nr:hypothetical protein [Streptomyces cyaneochromogenes]